MTNQPRVAKVLVALLVSMTVGAIVLMALGNRPTSAGAFCLSSYYRLDPIEQALLSNAPQTPERWNSIQVFYSGTKAGNIEQLAALGGLANSEELNCHFVVANGLGASDGEILSTSKWQKQWSIIPGRTWYGSQQAIRICVIADGLETKTTDTQIKRVESLVETLSRKFQIRSDGIFYPNNWR